MAVLTREDSVPNGRLNDDDSRAPRRVRDAEREIQKDRREPRCSSRHQIWPCRRAFPIYRPLSAIADPTWALTTVFVIIIVQFVGAVAEKSILRVIGTVIEGVIGYLLTAGFEQQPVLYLLLVGGVVGFGTAMFGYTKYPYAFLLCGLTTMAVASNGMSDPGFSWKPGPRAN
jgi:Fusaric acid resistance protein family